MRKLIVFVLFFATAKIWPIDMVFVQGGVKTLGEREQKENPPHTVLLDDFWMADREVSVREWEVFLSDTGYPFEWSDHYNGDYRECFISPDSAMGFVTYFETALYCNWLSRKEGLTECYIIDLSVQRVYWNRAANGYRMPTEAEWEYAASGGQKGKKTRYSGSDNADEVAWYYENSGLKSKPVKSKKSNELGIYDLSGNVFEWCFDFFDPDYIHEGKVYKNPVNEKPVPFAIHEWENSAKDIFVIVRGGAWGLGKTYLLNIFRQKAVMTSRQPFGIRLVRNHDKSASRYIREIHKAQ